MARYLNPAKIGLLVLLELYTEEAVPSDAILPVLSFISSYIIDHHPRSPSSDQQSRWNRAENTVNLVVSIKDFEKLLGSYPFIRGMPGRRLWDQFLDKLWAINSLHELHSFFDGLQSLVAKTREERKRETGMTSPEPEGGMKLARISPLGAFIRRSQIEFQRLRFHDSAELWKDFVRYRQPTSQQRKRRTPRMAFDNVLLEGEQHNEWDSVSTTCLASVVYGDMLSGGQTSTLPVSTDDIDALLEFQIEQMQKFGNRVPMEIKHQFHDLLRDSFVVPSTTHYLSYLDSWRSGDYPLAYDYLHRYFDYTGHNKDRVYYQYGLLNLAVLQADFGCHKEAVAAMLETVSTARENRDMSCLNFALNWLFNFGRSHPSMIKELESNSVLGSAKESLAFLRVKAKETGMFSLWSSVLLTEAKTGLENGDSVATAFEHLTRSSQLIIEKNMKTMFGSQMSLATAMWDRLGLAQLATITTEVFLRCHARHAVFEDELRLTCKLALHKADRGKYDEALQTLESIDENSLRSRKPGQYWFKYRGIVKLLRDLRHGYLDGAKQLLDQLMQLKNDELEPGLAFLVDTLHIDYLTRRGDLQAAFEKVEDLLRQLRDETRDVDYRIRLLLLKAKLLNECGRPQRGFSIAMRAASLAWRARLMTSLWSSMSALCTILITMNEFPSAVEILSAILPRAIECDSDDLTARLYVCLADANMGLAGEAEKAFDYYSGIEDAGKQCEMMAKKAVIMKVSGDMVLAADYAAAYVSLRKSAAALSLGGR
ncbi:hypothetical protein NLU13_0233 [Sarocladium strictum]|uniref:Anaphase-promoting complex subunit 5 n=1 Tax=Sarocladium strictum TaxID=5046 RepID=A0AA39GNN7_SARSR|nr:hypothetical protein NLU13_0233 [Sarocladium strictum]